MCDYQTCYSGQYQANIIFQDTDLVLDQEDLDETAEDFIKLPGSHDEAQA